MKRNFIFVAFFVSFLLVIGCNQTSSSPDTTTTTTTTTTTINPLDSYNWLKADTQEVTADTAKYPVRNTGASDWRDEIIYFLMTDRFSDGDTANNDANFTDKSNINYFHGGDLKGIINNVDYFKKLGATSIWITPIIENMIEDNQFTGYHGYWAHDFTVVDKHLTTVTNQDNTTDRLNYFKNFVDTMHNNGILVIQDIVVNHMGNHSLYKINNIEQWNPAYNSVGYGDASHLFISDSSNKDAAWVTNGLRTKPPAPFDNPAFYNNCGEIGNYNGNEQIVGDLSGLDDIKTSSTEVRQALIKIYSDWIKNAGVDGFRIDTIKHVEETFWDDFSPAIRTVANAQSKNFLQFGEALIGDHNQTKIYAQDQRLDSLLNFDLYYKILSVFKGGSGTSALTTELTTRKNTMRSTKLGNGGGNISAIDGAINFIDNHDVARFLDSSSVSLAKYWNAITYLMTTSGIPCIYYNTENDTVGSTNDIGRKDMPDFNTTNKKTLSLIRKLSKIRKDNVTIRRGDITVLKDSSTTSGIFAFVRSDATLQNENVFVVFNNSNSKISVTINLGTYANSGDTLKNILYDEFGSEETLTVDTNKDVTIEINPHSPKIFKKQ